MSFSQKANSSKGKRYILDMKITKFLPFACLQTAFVYQKCTEPHLASNSPFSFQMTKEEKLAYYEMAMKMGLPSRLIPDNFTCIGKMRIKTPKYNSPRVMYSEDTLEDMIGGSTVE